MDARPPGLPRSVPTVFLVGLLGLGALSTVNPARGGQSVRAGQAACPLVEPDSQSAAGTSLGQVPGLTSHLSLRVRAP